MANRRQIVLAGIIMAGISCLTGAKSEAALSVEQFHTSAQVYADERPRLVDADSVIYLDGEDKISVEGENISSIDYSSSDSRVAKIDDKGRVTPLATGKTEIQATVTYLTDDERKTEALSYDLQVLPKSIEYFKYDSIYGKSRIVGLTAKGKQLQDVYIPGWCEGEKVLEIHVDTFKDDTALQRVYVPDNPIHLDYQRWEDDYVPGKSFSGCTNLKELHLGKDLVGVGCGFASSLEKITVDERNETFQVKDNVLFSGKTKLICYPGARKDAFYQIPEEVKIVEEDAFFGAVNLKKVGIPNGIEQMGRAFRYAGLTEVVVPESVKYYSLAFEHCAQLEKAAIETEEGYHVFEGCEKLKSVSVKKAISGEVLAGCKSVEEICLAPNAEGISVKDGVLFSDDGKRLFAYPTGKKGEYSLPAVTEKIEECAFADAAVSKVVLNQGLKEIGKSAFEKAGITAIELPDSVDKIGTMAFEECQSLSSAKLSKNLKVIPDNVFRNCVSLKKLYIPKKVEKIGISRGCKKLTEFTVEKGNSSYVAVKGVLYSKSQKILYAYPSGKKGKSYVVPDSVQKIWGSAFADNHYLQNISMGNRVTYCGDAAFSDAVSLVKLSLSKNISYLGEYAFSGCKKLQAVTVPDKVKRLRCATFSGCTAIKSITLGKKVNFVDIWNFNGCKNLQRLTCRSLIEDWNFGNCVGGSFDEAGSKNYKKLIVSFPECKSKNKRKQIKLTIHAAGLSKKASVVFGK